MSGINRRIDRNNNKVKDPLVAMKEVLAQYEPEINNAKRIATNLFTISDALKDKNNEVSKVILGIGKNLEENLQGYDDIVNRINGFDTTKELDPMQAMGIVEDMSTLTTLMVNINTQVQDYYRFREKHLSS